VDVAVVGGRPVVNQTCQQKGWVQNARCQHSGRFRLTDLTDPAALNAVGEGIPTANAVGNSLVLVAARRVTGGGSEVGSRALCGMIVVTRWRTPECEWDAGASSN
jgi:hypothetical protein